MINGNLVLFQAAINPQGHFPCSRDASGAIIKTPACTLTLPVNSPSFARSYRYRDFALYARDSWKIAARLTLNYGLRYEYYGIQHNGDPKLDSNLYYGSGTNLFERLHNAQMLLAPNSPIGELWKPRYGDLGPRVGFAYSLTGDGKTSIRGGDRINYEPQFWELYFQMIPKHPNYARLPITLAQSRPST